MPILTSRPPTNVSPSVDLMSLVAPAVNVLDLISNLIVYTDDTQKSVTDARHLLEETLECFNFEDYEVLPAGPITGFEIIHDVAIQPIQGSPFISFRVIFQVRP